MHYIDDTIMHEIRTKIINWAVYRQSGLISQDDYKTMSTLEKSPEAFFNEYTELAITTSLRLLTDLITEEDALLSILVMIDDYTQNDNLTRIEDFHTCGSKMSRGLWTPFLKLIEHGNNLIVHMAAHFLARLASQGHEHLSENDQIKFYNFLKHRLDASLIQPNDYMQTELHCLQIMLTHDCYRKTFVQTEGIMLLIRLLPRHNIQVQYQAVFCLWVLSFNKQVATRMNKYTFIPTMMKIINDCQKEKLMRVALAFFVNILQNCTDEEIALEHCALLLHFGMLNTVHTILQHTIQDPELKESAEALKDHLNKAVDQLCTFARYAAELRSESLTWTPVHRSTKFWAENALRLNENNFELLRILISMLEFSKESITLAVALQDIGQYVSRYPDGKAVLDSMGGKVLVLQLLSHYDKEVRYEALMTASQLLKVH